MKLGEYLKRYPELERVVRAAVRCMPGGEALLDEVEVAVDPAAEADYANLEERRIVFREDPPSAVSVLHELVHITGGDEVEATVFSHLLASLALVDATCDVAGFARWLTLDKLDEALRRAAGIGLDEWFEEWSSGGEPIYDENVEEWVQAALYLSFIAEEEWGRGALKELVDRYLAAASAESAKPSAERPTSFLKMHLVDRTPVEESSFTAEHLGCAEVVYREVVDRWGVVREHLWITLPDKGGARETAGAVVDFFRMAGPLQGLPLVITLLQNFCGSRNAKAEIEVKEHGNKTLTSLSITVA